MVLRVDEVSAGVEHPSMGAAVRNLLKRRLRVVVDSSDSCLDKMALLTLREKVSEVCVRAAESHCCCMDE